MIYRAQCSVWYDSTLPRDAMTINPHFNDRGPTSSPSTLANDLATILSNGVTGTPQIQVKLYDAQDPPPNFPKATKILNVGNAPASSVCRELALCLSYYAGENRPTKRGRLYFPLQWNALKTVGVRPTAGQQTDVQNWATHFSSLGGADVDWGVYSRKLDSFDKVTNVYIDDEWDIMRSRGLRPTTRLASTPSG
jgi:hypothetical protein